MKPVKGKQNRETEREKEGGKVWKAVKEWSFEVTQRVKMGLE